MTDTEEFITPSTDVKVYESFDDMGLSEELLRGVYSNGFTKPSAIQTKGIMPMVERRDLIAQAQSGTGKTGTFVIGSLSTVDPSIKKPQVLVLVHVRELAQQIQNCRRGFPIQIPRRLVRHQQGRVRDERTRNGHALLLPPGKFTRRVMRPVR